MLFLSSRHTLWQHAISLDFLMPRCRWQMWPSFFPGCPFVHKLVHQSDWFDVDISEFLQTWKKDKHQDPYVNFNIGRGRQFKWFIWELWRAFWLSYTYIMTQDNFFTVYRFSDSKILTNLLSKPRFGLKNKQNWHRILLEYGVQHPVVCSEMRKIQNKTIEWKWNRGLWRHFHVPYTLSLLFTFLLPLLSLLFPHCPVP